MGTRESWARSFSAAGEELWMQKKNGDVGLFVSRKSPEPVKTGAGWDWADLPSPVWHVWVGDDWRYCGLSMQEAYRAYEEAVKSRG